MSLIHLFYYNLYDIYHDKYPFEQNCWKLLVTKINDFLQDNKNAVIVFEDCEKLLSSRKNGKNDGYSCVIEKKAVSLHPKSEDEPWAIF